ncbi:type II toxin-antitoxin system VapB family antitoxin [Sphingomonas sp.]|uniref:type II toxin-antitoxin system VapB family antitoxin n=1 Tax=Sphingomonas sp. TaxID=28214 RepID=UPI0026246CA7|nr:type II toxin-antitoxin system VapB family antitoxin [Sphingomonas sp.]MDK2767101.1 type II toxin-antitoxin system VapB family antitoxin [Sphingomonas sp.]
MTKRINIKNPEVVALARELARLDAKPVNQVVKEALQSMSERMMHESGRSIDPATQLR